MAQLFSSRAMIQPEQLPASTSFSAGETIEVFDDAPTPQSHPTSFPSASVFCSPVVDNSPVLGWCSDFVDETVLAELPWDLQQEIRQQMHRPKHSTSMETGNSTPTSSASCSNITNTIASTTNELHCRRTGELDDKEGTKKRRILEHTTGETVVEIMID